MLSRVGHLRYTSHVALSMLLKIAAPVTKITNIPLKKRTIYESQNESKKTNLKMFLTS